MSDRRLTKKEAYRLITSIVDDEVDEETRTEFFTFIEGDEEVKREFESVKRLKSLIATRCPYHKAPDTLKYRIKQVLVREQEASEPGLLDQDPVFDIPSDFTPTDAERHRPEQGYREPRYINWLYAAAASLMVILAFWGLIYKARLPAESYQIERYVYQYYEDHGGQLVPPTINTANLADAEVQLASHYDMSLTIPPLRNAEFKGVVYEEFVPNYSAPLLEYYLPKQEQYIYIFAFDLDKLNRYSKLNRNEEAVKTCVRPEDFHIEQIGGKHILSWRWNGTWYAAISNHDGKTLASLVEPLNYSLQ